jgi:hypothetical protein
MNPIDVIAIIVNVVLLLQGVNVMVRRRKVREILEARDLKEAAYHAELETKYRCNMSEEEMDTLNQGRWD